MSSTTTILQLRQQESSNVTQNGVYETTLDHPIQLEEGDVVQVKAVYLDTVADVIELTEDEEITMEAMIYVQNYKLDQKFLYLKDSAEGTLGNLKLYPQVAGNALRTEDELGDNQLWFLSTSNTNSGTTNWNVPKLNVVPINTTSDTKRFGDITLEFEFTPITPNAKKTTSSLHLKSFIDRRWQNHTPRDLGISCTGTDAAPTLVLKTTKQDLTNAGIASVSWDDYQVKIPDGEVQIEPQRFPISFIIPRGTYTPSEISQLITDSVNELQYTGAVSTTYGGTAATYPNPPTQTNYPSMNPWLQTVLKNVHDLSIQTGTGADAATQLFVNTNPRYGGTQGGGKLYFEYDLDAMVQEYVRKPLAASDPAYRPPLDKLLGTNQFAMEFDIDENKIKMVQMHFPLYVNDTTAQAIVEDGNPGVAFNEAKVNTAPPAQAGVFQPNGGIVTAYSGICFSSLTPGWFWDAMGFGSMTVNPVKNVKLEYPTFGAGNVPTADNSYTMEAVVGTNTTGAFEGLDIPVIHSNAYTFPAGTDAKPTQFGRFSVPRQDAQLGDDVFISTGDVSSIFSSNTLNDNIADEGYFLVDVSSNFKQNLIGGKLGDQGGLRTSRDTQSIVNRYYTSGSFTSDQGAGSIVYEHVGEPQMLSNFGVKVRNPNGTFVSDTVLKPKNAIFIEVIKQNKPSK